MRGRFLKSLNSINVRVMGVVILSGIVTAAVVVVSVSRAMHHHEEAKLVEGTLTTAEQLHHDISTRFAISESQLRAAALLFEAGRAPEIAGLLAPVITSTRFQRDGEILQLGTTSPQHARAPTGRTLVGPATVLLREDVGGVEVTATVELSDLLLNNSKRQTSLVAHSPLVEPATEQGAPLLVRREWRDGTEWAVAVQALGPGLFLSHTVSLASAKSEVDAAISSALWFAAIVAGSILLVLAWILARTVTRPVRVLANALRDDHADLRVGMPDNEIGALAHEIAASREALARDLSWHATSATFAQEVVRLTEPDAVLALLQTVVDATHAPDRWRVMSTDDLDATKQGAPPSPANEQTVIQLGDDGTVYGSLRCAAAVPEPERRHVEVLSQIATTAVRGLGFGEVAATNEKLAVIGRLSASIAHEMNNPLLYMLANLSMLEEELEGGSREMAADARAGAERLAEIVKDMSTLSRGGSESVRRTDLGALVADRVKIANGRARRVVVTVDVPEPVFVTCASGPVGQAILNLLVNAIDAVRGLPDPRVTVSVIAGAAQGTVVVTDNGGGISPANQRRLFGAFFTTKQESGTGLGLYLSRMFARASGGDLALVDTGSRGTTFRLALPLSLVTRERPVSSPVIAATGGLRVLVVDDEPAIVRSLERLLGRYLEVIGTTNPGEGLALATTQAFHLILCDWNMPGMSGGEFLARLKSANAPNADHVVIMTGGELPQLEDVRVISKPIERAMIEHLIHGARSQEDAVDVS